MPEDVYLAFASEDDRKLVMERLRNLNLPDGEVSEYEDLIRLDDAQSPDAANVRAQTIVRGVCDGTEVDLGSIRFQPGGWGPV